MKIKLTLSLLFVALSSILAKADLFVNQRGTVSLNSIDPLYQVTPHNNDSITSLKIFEPEVGAPHPRISFGDQGSIRAMNVMVGEVFNGDSDQLWLHGKKGLYYTCNHLAGDTVFYYDTNKGDYFQFNCDVRSTGVFVASDSRFKRDIRPLDRALGALSSLSPVSYRLNPRLDAAKALGENTSIETRSAGDGRTYRDKTGDDQRHFSKFYGNMQKDVERYGFLAQEVQSVYPELVRTDEKGYMYVDYIGMIPLLVGAIGELNQKIEQLENEKAALIDSQDKTDNVGNEESGMMDKFTTAKLFQNAPNPFTSSTAIRYTLPDDVKDASILIFDMQGKLLKTIAVNDRGSSSVTIEGNDLAAGMYIYALVADGAEVDSKRMILTK